MVNTFHRNDATFAQVAYADLTGASILQGFLGGLTLSNDGTTPNTVLDIAAGICADSTAATYIQLGTFTKKTSGTWVAGTGNNGMGTGLTVAASTWYHVFAIINGGTADVYFDTSVTAANKPASTTAFRRVGSILTDGSSNILAFTQTSGTFIWSAIAAVNTSVGTSASLITVQTPLGVKTQVLARFLVASANTNQFLITSPDETDVAPGASFSTSPGYSMTGGSAQIAIPYLLTNTSSQIRVRSSAAAQSVETYTHGYVDSRGQG